MKLALKKQERHPRFEPLTLTYHGQRPTCYPTMFLVCIDRDWYVPISTNRCLDILTETQKQNPLTVDDASTAEAAPKRVERDGQGETRRANTTPNGRPHLELGRLRLKTWSKSDFSIAETTWPTYRYIYFYKHKNRSASSFFLGGGCDERRSQMVIHVECTTTSYQVTNKRPNGSWLTNLLNLLAPIGWGPPAS